MRRHQIRTAIRRPPGVHHTVSENVSTSAPAKLLAIFVADTKDKNLVIWDKK
jgi:hypothetical protein